MICGHGKIPNGVPRPSEIWGTLVEPVFLLDCIWLNQARQRFVAWKLVLEKSFKDRQLLLPPGGASKSKQLLFMASLNLGGYFFQNKTFIFGREGILYSNCQLQEPSGQGIWLLKSCQTDLVIKVSSPGKTQRGIKNLRPVKILACLFSESLPLLTRRTYIPLSGGNVCPSFLFFCFIHYKHLISRNSGSCHLGFTFDLPLEHQIFISEAFDRQEECPPAPEGKFKHVSFVTCVRTSVSLKSHLIWINLVRSENWQRKKNASLFYNMVAKSG